MANIGQSIGAAVSLRHLEYVVAASRYGSFRKAAAMLEIQESTISRAIRDLENKLGASLFHRHVSGVTPTIAGEQFARRATAALSSIGNGIRDVSMIGCCQRGHLRVGIFSSLASGFISELLRKFDEGHADVRLDFVDGKPTDHVASIRQLALDVAFVTGTRRWTDCDTHPLWSERVFAVLPSDHILAKKRELNWIDLENERFVVSDVAPVPEIHDYLVQRLANLNHHPKIETQQVSRDNLLSLVAVGRGLALTSEATTVTKIPGIVFRPIANEILPFSAVWSPRNDNPALRRLLSMARQMSVAAGI